MMSTLLKSHHESKSCKQHYEPRWIIDFSSSVEIVFPT